MTTDLPLSANWLLNVYVNDVNAIRFDDERLRAIDAAIDEHNVAIEALKAERGALRAAQEERIEARNRALCTALHVKLDEDKCPVRRQGPPKKERAAEPPALVSPTPDPVLANLVNDAARGLAASGVPIDGYTPDGVPFGPGAAGGGVVLVGTERPTSPVSVAPTAAEEFIADVSEPEHSLLEQGFTLDEIAATPVDERWRLKRGNVNRDDVIRSANGIWYEPATKRPEPIENEEAPF